MAVMDNGEMEIVVIIPYTARVFKKNAYNELRHLRLYVRRWFRSNVGEHTPPLEMCSAAYPWRCRTYDVTAHHMFLFRNPSDALLFKLTFGGS